MSRLVVITAENMASCRIVRPLLDQLGHEIALVMLVPNLPVDTGGRRKRAVRLVFKASLRFVFLKFIEIHLHHIVAWLSGITIYQYARRRGVTIRRYRSAADDMFLVDLLQANPLYTLSAGPAILSQSVIDAATCGTLNCHGGRLPEYRGAANYIWMLLTGERTAYATIQRMHRELDAGPVLAERSLTIDPEWSAYRLNYELSGLGGELYAKTVRAFLAGKPMEPLVRNDSVACNRGIPTRRDLRQFKKLGCKLFTFHEIIKLV